MTTIVSELYTALKAAGIDDGVARAAASSVLAIEEKEQLATKGDLALLRADLRTELADLKADLTWRFIVIMGAQTAIFSAIVAALKFVR